ncbi:MAG: hypothetical protein R6U44_03950 [Archaeoglobaceae archaeon]
MDVPQMINFKLAFVHLQARFWGITPYYLTGKMIPIQIFLNALLG